jgi:alpha-maltose-1-phosphate synthase
VLKSTLFFHPDAYIASGGKLMGRHAAGDSFLRGYLAHSKQDTISAFVTDPRHGETFRELLVSTGDRRSVEIVDKTSLGTLTDSVLYYPGPDIAGQAFNRSLLANSAFSISGVTHTTASATVMDGLSELITAPVQPWDAVICTSNAVKTNVETLLQGQVDYLRDRLGISKLTLPKFPVIPLGIHTADFRVTNEAKRIARQALGISGNDVVVLFLGRLSFHAKAHPLAMYQALEAAAKSAPNGGKVVLIECGWFANDWIREAFEEASSKAYPSIKVIRLDGRVTATRDQAWASADIFCSFSDNIQETFGLSPVEAMATGLPVVVSDWNGYKESVRDGVDGFRIPTLMPGAGLDGDLAYRHALGIDTYDAYCGYASSFVSVDIEAATKAFSQLFSSPDLRVKMGQSGQKRATEVYDWKQIIPQYEALWEELGTIRAAARQSPNQPPSAWPARTDPYKLFANYPTKILAPQTEIALGPVAKNGGNWSAILKLRMVTFTKPLIASDQEINALIDRLKESKQSVNGLLTHYPTERQAIVFRTISFVIKLGILKVV